MKSFIPLLFLLLIISGCNQAQKPTELSNYLLLFNDTVTDGYGYKNANGDIVIAEGKYAMCFTDTFKTYAIVVKPDSGFVAIDRQENVLYKVYPFDNGPDEASDGLFRIIENNKMGYANALTGAIVIQPQFKCAWPFKDGTAKVSNDCKTQTDGEHSTWVSNNWFYIDTTGKTLAAPKTSGVKN